MKTTSEWNNTELARSLFGLVKAGGMFKSEKHMTFLREGKMYAAERRIHATEDDLKFFRSNFGVLEAEMNDTIYMLDGWISWANYGRKSQRRMEHVFLMDQYGIRAQYKLHFSYSDNGNYSQVNPKKTEVVWQRPANAELVAFEKPVVAPKEAGEFIGAEKQRMVFEGEIVFAKHTGFGMYGPTYITVVKQGNNTVVYFGLLEHVDYRGKIKFKATVKAHNERDGIKQTIVNRPAVMQ